VPLGRYTRRILERASSDRGAAFGDGVMTRVVSEEMNARLVRARLLSGDAEAAFLYAPDLAQMPPLRRVPIPSAYAETATYFCALVSAGMRQAQALRWQRSLDLPEQRARRTALGFHDEQRGRAAAGPA
ncbi:MAG: substrate-binding domain-containing protein, partial [Myxococcota bacterium]